MSFCAHHRAKSWRQTLKFHSPASPDPLNAYLLGFPKSPPLKILDLPMTEQVLWNDRASIWPIDWQQMWAVSRWQPTSEAEQRPDFPAGFNENYTRTNDSTADFQRKESLDYWSRFLITSQICLPNKWLSKANKKEQCLFAQNSVCRWRKDKVQSAIPLLSSWLTPYRNFAPAITPGSKCLPVYNRFTNYLTTVFLRLSYDNATVTIDLWRTSNLQNILRRRQSFS